MIIHIGVVLRRTKTKAHNLVCDVLASYSGVPFVSRSIPGPFITFMCKNLLTLAKNSLKDVQALNEVVTKHDEQIQDITAHVLIKVGRA